MVTTKQPSGQTQVVNESTKEWSVNLIEGYVENELTQTSCLSPGEPCWARIGTGNFQGQSLKDD